MTLALPRRARRRRTIDAARDGRRGGSRRRPAPLALGGAAVAAAAAPARAHGRARGPPTARSARCRRGARRRRSAGGARLGRHGARGRCRPHVTVARVRRGAARRGRRQRARGATGAARSTARRVVLYALAPRSRRARATSRSSARRAAQSSRLTRCAVAPQLRRDRAGAVDTNAPYGPVPSDRAGDTASFRHDAERSQANDRRGEGRQGPRRRPAGRADPDRAPVRQGHRHAHGRRGRAGAASTRSRPARCRSTSRSGIGGVPRGRIVEIFGPESSGKTTLVYHVLAEAQKLGGICAFIDAEHAMDPLYAQEIGVDIDELLVSQPDYGEQALEIADMLVRSGAVDVVAVDSVAALTPRAELEGQMGDQTVGLQARMMSPGDAQARRQPQPHADALPLHEPDPREGRRDVRLAGDPAGRPRAEVLLVPAPRHPPHRDAQGGHRGGRQPGARQGRQEQGRRAVPPGRVRHRVRQGHLDVGLPARPRASSTTSSRSPARSSPTATSGSARGATTPRRSSTSTRRSRRRSRARSTTRSASTATSSRRSSRGETAVADVAEVDRSRRPRRAGPTADALDSATLVRDSTPTLRLQHALDLAFRYLGRRDRTVLEVRAATSRASASSRTRSRRRSRELRDAGLPRRRALRPALRRGPAAPRRLGRRADRAPARRARRATPEIVAAAVAARDRGERAARPRSRCCAGASRRRRRTTAERERALGVLVRKGYELELAYGRDPRARARRRRLSAEQRSIRARRRRCRLRQPGPRYYDPAAANDRPARARNTSKSR